MPAAGGKAEVLTTPDRAKGEIAHLLPHVLPGGEAVLFSTQTSPSWWDNPRFAASGHLVFIRQGTLWAVPFDISQLKVTGEPVQLIENVMQATNAINSTLNTFAAPFSVSSLGTLAYVTGGPYPDMEHWLLWIDSKGAAHPARAAAAASLAAGSAR